MAVNDMMKGEIVLDEQQTKWLKTHYKHTKNKELAEKFGISIRTLRRLAVDMCLSKSKQFMRKTQKEATDKAHKRMSDMRRDDPEEYERVMAKSKLMLKTYGPIGAIKKGEQRFTKKQRAKMEAKRHETMEKMRNRDRARVRIGLEPLTKLPLGYTNKERKAVYKVKWRLCKIYGYSVGECRTMYYNRLTRRVKNERYYEERYKMKFVDKRTADTERKDVKLPPDWMDKQGGFNCG